MKASMEQSAVKVPGPHDGKVGFLGTIGVRFMIGGDETAQFSVVAHGVDGSLQQWFRPDVCARSSCSIAQAHA